MSTSFSFAPAGNNKFNISATTDGVILNPLTINSSVDPGAVRMRLGDVADEWESSTALDSTVTIVHKQAGHGGAVSIRLFDVGGGSVFAVADIDSGGSGYTTPIATVSGGSGSGLSIGLTASGGVITVANVTSQGSGYSASDSNIVVSLSDPGSTATNVCAWSDGTSATTLQVTAEHTAGIIGDVCICNIGMLLAGTTSQSLIIGKPTNPIRALSTYFLTYNTLLTESDERIKANITDANLTTSLSIINNLKVREYNYVGDMSSIRVRGFIAQEVYSVIPQAILVGDGKLQDGTIVSDFHYLSKDKIVADLVAAVQALSLRVTALEQQ